MGMAYLVGAGPGDPGLLTVRAAELLRSADVIVHDALANPAIIADAAAANPAVVLMDVGKRGGEGDAAERQEAINSLLVQLVRKGKKVVRLKGGDPFVFGRGGEEALVLVEAQVPFEIVPGVTAGIAAPAYAGIPVTHRGMSAAVTFVTAHEDPMKGAPRVNYSALAGIGGTIVLYMGVRKLPEVAPALIEGGLPPEIPCAVVEWGTYPRQRTVVATLGTIAEVAARAEIVAPAITVVGWSVVLRDELAWYDRRPLSNRRIMVPRSKEAAGASKLSRALTELGAEVVEISATRLSPLPDTELMSRMERLAEYEWIIFTSQHAVALFWDALLRSGRDARALAACRIAAVGPATAEELARHGLVVDVRAARFVAEGLLDALSETNLVGAGALYPCAAGARDVLSNGLAELGADVDRVDIYESRPNEVGRREIRDAVSGGGLTLAAFTSASAVKAYIDALPTELVGTVPAASIGPITTAALAEAGVPVVVEAEESTVAELVRAVTMYFESPPPYEEGSADDHALPDYLEGDT